MGRTVFALFDDFPVAQRVAKTLEREGYAQQSISVVAPDPRGEYATAAANGGDAEDSLAFARLSIPGVGPAAVAGPLAVFLAESNGGAAGLVGSLTKAGFAAPNATHYYESLRRGQALIAVESPEDRVRQTQEAMRRLGARAVTETGSVTGVEGRAKPGPVREGVRSEVTVPVVEEQLEVAKRQVNRGGVRIHSRIVEQPVRENLLLREERVSVERRPVYRDATEEDLAGFKEGSFEIHETVEEPVITKRRRVVEEIVIGRETRERTETIHETVRKTQVDVEALGPGVGGPTEAGDARGEDFGPAQRYGSALAADERYRDAEWRDVEQDAQRAWEEQNPGTWEQFKDTVRGAWDRVRGR